MADQILTPNAAPEYPMYGEIWDIRLDPVIGSEIGKTRPALLVSNDLNNKYADLVTVLPLTSHSSSRQYPFEVLIPDGIAGLTAQSRIKANQVRSVDKQRLVRLRGKLPPEFLPQVEKALKIHLNMR
jgi:mRNA interferase MazF